MDPLPSALTWPESSFCLQEVFSSLGCLTPPARTKPETMLEVGAPCTGKGGFPGAIRPKKECIKSCETCFANTLNLNDKDPSMKRVCFRKVFWSFSYLTLTQNKPSEFFECYLFDYYCLTMIDELSIYALYSYAN